MMLGCSSLADVRASRWNRSTNSLSNARENGRTLIATSRSSCFSRALKTMAIPPRPSSSRISYSSFSCSRTRSSSVTSICWSRTAATGVVCDRSSPQERQNLLASSFWVPQREQQPVLDAARRRALAAQLARRIPAKGKRARRAQRRREEDIHALWRHAAYAKQRAERTVGAADEEPQRQHVVGEAAQTGYAGVERQPGAQLIRPATGTRLLPPSVSRGPRKPVLGRDRKCAVHQPRQRERHRAADETLCVTPRADGGEGGVGDRDVVEALELRREAHARQTAPAARHERRAERRIAVELRERDIRRARRRSQVRP